MILFNRCITASWFEECLMINQYTFCIMFLIPIWGVMAPDSTPCLNEWVHVEIVKIGLRGKVMQTSLVSLLDVEGCRFRCGCGQQLASVGLALCRLRWITLQTNSLQEELEDAGRALLYPNGSWSHLYTLSCRNTIVYILSLWYHFWMNCVLPFLSWYAQSSFLYNDACWGNPVKKQKKKKTDPDEAPLFLG